MIQYFTQNARMSVGYIETMLKDIPDADLASPAGAIVNHPAWQVGHIAGGFAYAAMLCGKPIEAPAWVNACGGGKIPVADRSAFPSKEEMISTMKKLHEAAISALAEASKDTLEAQMPNEQFRAIFPKTGDAVCFLIEAHASNHSGQLAMWRRVKGYKYMF